MTNLTKEQIDELKEKGIITSTLPSEVLINNVDGLKIDKLITLTTPSEDIEDSVKEQSNEQEPQVIHSDPNQNVSLSEEEDW